MSNELLEVDHMTEEGVSETTEFVRIRARSTHGWTIQTSVENSVVNTGNTVESAQATAEVWVNDPDDLRDLAAMLTEEADRMEEMADA